MVLRHTHVHAAEDSDGWRPAAAAISRYYRTFDGRPEFELESLHRDAWDARTGHRAAALLRVTRRRRILLLVRRQPAARVGAQVPGAVQQGRRTRFLVTSAAAQPIPGSCSTCPSLRRRTWTMTRWSASGNEVMHTRASVGLAPHNFSWLPKYCAERWLSRSGCTDENALPQTLSGAQQRIPALTSSMAARIPRSVPARDPASGAPAACRHRHALRAGRACRSESRRPRRQARPPTRRDQWPALRGSTSARRSIDVLPASMSLGDRQAAQAGCVLMRLVRPAR